MSYMINSISERIHIKDNGTVTDRGLRVDRLIDNDVYNEIKSTYTNSFDYNISIDDHIYGYFIQNIFKPEHNYHLFTINSYYYQTQNDNTIKYKNDQEVSIDNQYERTYFKPIIRINRTIDNFGLYDDLIFSNITTDIKNLYHIKCDQDTKVLYSGEENEFKDFLIGQNDNYNYLEYDYDDMYKSDNTLVWYNLSNAYFNDRVLNTIDTTYLNKFSLNIPIVGAKQSICLGLDMVNYVSKNIFKGGESGQEDLFYYYNYIFSDYLFLFNNTNTVITLLISDPSLSLINKQHALIQLKPKEFKLYYPNNFNYNGDSNYNKKKIYTIKIINKTTNILNMIFEYYHLGSLNKSLNLLVEEGQFNKQLGYNLVTNLIYHYYNYINNNSEITRLEILKLYDNICEEIINSNNDNIDEIKKLIQNMPNKYINNLNINISNYSENQAGHLVIINSNKIFKKDEFYLQIDNQASAKQSEWFIVETDKYDGQNSTEGQDNENINTSNHNDQSSIITQIETNNSNQTNP